MSIVITVGLTKIEIWQNGKWVARVSRDLPLQEPERIGVGTSDVVEGMLQPVNGDSLPLAHIELLGIQVPNFLGNREELEGEA